jgi:superfamily II DNA/RNA helicase
VYDEADMLLGGSYGRHIKALRELFRIADKEAAEEGVRVELGMSEEEWEMVPWRMQRIAVNQGVAGLEKAGFKVPVNSNDSIESILDGLPPLDDSSSSSSSSSQKQQLPVQKRQYIYVAATMPSKGDHTVGANIAAAHPTAVWLSGHALHQGQGASVTHNWVQLSSPSVEERHAAAAEVIRSDALLSKGQGRVLVFTKDIASAEATAAALSSALSIPVLKYHKEVPPLDRSQALDTISTKQGVVLVATDAAARGLDLPDISHVIQADFASSAIDFLHRVGRTARAGKSGKVTSLYNEDNAMLVGAIKEAIKEGVPVEGAFSRNRSFKKKVRKYGKYVPRGRGA